MNTNDYQPHPIDTSGVILSDELLELAELMARELKSPKAIDRMTSYVRQVRPQSEEMLVDEMLAICADINAWREKKESQEAQAKYNARLFYSRFEDGQGDE